LTPESRVRWVREGTAGRLENPARSTCPRTSTLRISHFPDPRLRRYNPTGTPKDRGQAPRRNRLLTTEGSRKDAGPREPVGQPVVWQPGSQPLHRTTRPASVTSLNAVGATGAEPSPYQVLSGENISQLRALLGGQVPEGLASPSWGVDRDRLHEQPRQSLRVEQARSSAPDPGRNVSPQAAGRCFGSSRDPARGRAVPVGGDLSACWAW